MSSSTVLSPSDACIQVAQTFSEAESNGLVPPSEFSTERLHLRRLRLSDAGDYFSFSSCALVTRYLPWRTHRNIDEALMDIEMYLQGEKENRFTWAVTVTGTEQLVGLVGCEVRKGDIGIGYILDSQVWGRGYAAESANTLLAWAGKHPDIAVAWAVCDAENVSSCRVLSKIGFFDSGVPWTISCPNLSEMVRKAYLYVRRCDGKVAA
jgi:ribosomal-protein-alanine N-acetyltransferase